MPSLFHVLIKFLTALLKHQARRWLGEEALGIADARSAATATCRTNAGVCPTT